MKTLKTLDGHVVKISDGDLGWLELIEWRFIDGEVVSLYRVPGGHRSVSMDRTIMIFNNGDPVINLSGDPLDMRRENLRTDTRYQLPYI